MRLTINDKEVVFPSSLAEITLGQRIDFYNTYGRDLDAMLKSIHAMPDGIDKDLETTQFHFEKMFRTFAFFCNCTVEALKESEFVDTIATVYHSCLSVLFDDEQQVELQPSYYFNGEEWFLSEPELKQGGKITFGEFIDAKQLIKDAHDLGQGKWESMLKICAIFLRKKDEVYKEEFTYEGSDRMELFKRLPMSIAMAVGFFLSASINLSINTLKYLENPGSKDQASIPKSIMKSMAG